VGLISCNPSKLLLGTVSNSKCCRHLSPAPSTDLLKHSSVASSAREQCASELNAAKSPCRRNARGLRAHWRAFYRIDFLCRQRADFLGRETLHRLAIRLMPRLWIAQSSRDRLFPHLTVGDESVIGHLRFSEGLLQSAGDQEFFRPFLIRSDATSTRSDGCKLPIAEHQLVPLRCSQHYAAFS